jgi:hypothetical protein
LRIESGLSGSFAGQAAFFVDLNISTQTELTAKAAKSAKD